MLSIQKCQYAIDVMGEMFSQADCELIHKNVFELLIATILSAQTIDISVNRVTPTLQSTYPTPELLAHAELEDIMAMIKFYRKLS